MRQDADERLADGLAPAGVGDVADDHDGLVAGRREADADRHRVGRQLEPAVRVGRERRARPGPPAARASARGRSGRRAGRGRRDRSGSRCRGRAARRRGWPARSGRPHAHTTTRLAHGPDDRVQLGRPSVLGLGQALETDLDLDPVGDVAGDRDDGRRPVAGGEWLQHDLDRHRRAARRLDLGHHRRGVSSSGGDLVDEAGQPGRVGRPDEIGERAADRSRRGRAPSRTSAPRFTSTTRPDSGSSTTIASTTASRMASAELAIVTCGPPARGSAGWWPARLIQAPDS